MWLLFAFGSALFAGVTAILAKTGVRDADPYLATALRTAVVLVFAWLMAFAAGSVGGLPQIDGKSLLFLFLSGLTTGASWICYFKALQLGDVNKVAPVDKSSTILTMLLAILFLGEAVTALTLPGMLGIGAGTLLTLEKKPGKARDAEGAGWFVYAALSAVFASLTSVLGKVGIENVESNLGTALRTVVVLAMAWGIVFALKKQREIPAIGRKSWGFLGASGLTTGLSWLCYYHALQEGPASVVVPVDKLSLLVTAAFSCLFLKEKLSAKALLGLALITAGTLLLALQPG